MAILNITYRGRSADYPVEIDGRLTDADVRRIAVEVVRTGGVPGMHISNLTNRAFEYFVIDRFKHHRGVERIYLRPKVPFGA